MGIAGSSGHQQVDSHTNERVTVTEHVDSWSVRMNDDTAIIDDNNWVGSRIKHRGCKGRMHASSVAGPTQHRRWHSHEQSPDQR